ncbi:MAG: hypothetical protein A2008_09795 [Candidatus Wallbacteria bacterium GWC2_49_35]|uniref:AIM24 family protein n=1 Tax=Candidatus Wallbacteria bacterium GWC2_49_35 TaxID=1817813 RepID=A0A1F7WDP5_9BACT|nr:MAG: hypothetical protein A2008_09795 [Candidatus Wallbacteria bacterium GWC2_49_35]HBC75975.1 AIM24 family protein [Candidatus Wallbacteria bacterium]
MAQFEIIKKQELKMVKATLNHEQIRAESGALHYMQGKLELESKMPSATGFLKSFVTGENVFKPVYSGTGEIFFGPPTFGEYLILTLNNEEWILDKSAYICSDIGVEVGAYTNKAISGLFSGEGFFQTSVKGSGQVVIHAPGEVERIKLVNDRLAVDGSFAIARTAGLNFSVQKATKSIMGSMTSGEGLLNVFEGTGTVLIAPVSNLYFNLASMIMSMRMTTK